MTDHDLLGDNLSGFPNHQLVAARESLGLTSSALQRELRLTRAVFEAIESGDLSAIGQPVFARGYIRNYCNRVGLDSELFIEHYNAFAGVKPTKRSSKLKAAGSAAGNAALNLNPGRSSSVLSFLFRVLIIAVLLVGVAFAVMQINWSSMGVGKIFDFNDPSPTQEDSSGLPPMVGDENDLVIPVVPLTQPVDKDKVTPESSLDAEAQPEPTAQTIALDQPTELPDDAVKVVSVPVSDESQVQEPEVVQDANPAVTPSEPIAVESASAEGLVISFSDVSWLNIKDATGDALFNGLSKAGQTLNIDGERPLSVVIGRTNAVSNVTFNGKSVDLEPHTRKNVTRLTLSR